MKEKLLFDSVKDLEQAMIKRLRQGEKMFYFKMSNQAGYSMREIVQHVAAFIEPEISQDGTTRKVAISLNEKQRTGRIILEE